MWVVEKKGENNKKETEQGPDQNSTEIIQEPTKLDQTTQIRFLGNQNNRRVGSSGFDNRYNRHSSSDNPQSPC